ncbi:fructosamine kinase family protein [Rheinheimera metallidurans]|uniref:fructosamine kinase family protein n=1 Tax=Rheinheimera metallidurans TaxID=2925781 RepID=UPI003001F0DB
MWQAVTDHINSELESNFIIEHKIQLSGGNVNAAYHVTGNGQQFFVKINLRQQLEQFETEVLSLRTLQRTKCIRVPNPICSGLTVDKSFIVLEYLPFGGDTTNGWHNLAQDLAALHQQQQAVYGFDWDNSLATNTQPNKWQPNWSVFFSEQRIGWQLQLLHEQGLGFGKVDEIVEKTRQRLQGYQPKASLLHGDFWRGNLGFIGDMPAIFDPACYYGDRETDIAFSTLFGRLPDAFYQSYQQHYPLDKNYEQRKDLYNLYHVLNHANLFRGAYLIQAQELIKKLFY